MNLAHRLIMAVSIGAISILGLTACTSDVAQDPYVLAGLPLDESQNTEERYQILMDLISEATGREVVYLPTKDQAAIVTAVNSGRADFAQLGPLAYVLAMNSSNPPSMIAQSARSEGGTVAYKTYGVTRVGSGITSFSDLKGKKVCFSDPASLAAYLLPAQAIAASGLNPSLTETEDFEPVITGTFPQTAISISNGDCDAGFIVDVFYDTAIPASETVDMATLEKFWDSPDFPSLALVARSEIASTEIAEIQRVLFEKGNKTFLVEEGICSDAASCPLLTAATWGYVPGEDSSFDSVRAICSELELEQCSPKP